MASLSTRAAGFFACLVVLLVTGCRKEKPGFCTGDAQCPSGMRCDHRVMGCVAGDGGVDGNGDGGGRDTQDDVPPACTANSCGGETPVCDGTTKACRACASGGECAARSSSAPACSSSGACVECVGNGDCLGTRPICNTAIHTCRACAADAECPADPGVCLTDGHCATSGEVIFVEANNPACPNPSADGSTSNPFCTPNAAVAVVTVGRHVIVIRGAANNQLVLNTTGKAPVIVGRQDSGGNGGSVPATGATAITVSSDTVLIRDLTVNAGTTPTSKGIVVTGAGSSLTLLHVTASLGTGMGVDAEPGAALTMDECYVTGNSAGGLLVNGASYDIQNSIFAGNLYGVKFAASAVTTGSRFSFNTVAGNIGNAVTCDPGNPQALSDSIVAGANDSCTLTNSVPTAPTFDSTRAYHLTAKLSCPNGDPATFPDHDIDGDPRSAPIDCGADQYVP